MFPTIDDKAKGRKIQAFGSPIPTRLSSISQLPAVIMCPGKTLNRLRLVLEKIMRNPCLRCQALAISL